MKSYRAYSFHHTRTIEASFAYKTGRYSIIISVILEDFYNLLRHRRFGRKSKNEVMI